MSESVTLPAPFGPSWATFVDEWCLGVPPVTPPDTCARAFQALLEYWPERAQALISAPTRGLGVVVGAIDIGLILADTAHLVGVEPVLSRLRAGEGSSFSELTVAATLSRLGFSPELGVGAGVKVPDLAFTVGVTSVYAEVIAPDRAEIIKAVTDKINEIASSILAVSSRASVEVFLDCEPDTVDMATLSKTIGDSPFAEHPQEIPSIARFLKRLFSSPPVVSPSIASGTSGTVLGAARSIVNGANGVLVSVRVAVFDGRAKRLLAGELHHFSKTSPNVLVINTGNVPGGVKDWLLSLTRCFQPAQNTRISAIVLYQTGVLVNPIHVHRVWHVLINPHAANPLPERLLEALTTLPGEWPIQQGAA